MTNAISQLIRLRQSPILSQMRSLVTSTEGEDLFPFAFQKDVITRAKREIFDKQRFAEIFIITNPTNYGNASQFIGQRDVNLMAEDILANPEVGLDFFQDRFEGSLVILTNNNVARIRPERYAAIFDACPRTVFAVHDFDNHHWFDMSIQSAVISDVYIPAHLENFAISGRINSNILEGIPCGTIQWSKSFIAEHATSLLTINREIGPIGIHSYYESFRYRNQVLKTINRQFPKVGLLSGDFHNRTPLDRWNEWVSHELHWISPVYNDLPIRFFDALISGGMPMVPTSLAPYLRFIGIPSDFYITYSPSDLLNSSKLVQDASERFNGLGSAGIIERHAFAFKHFHVDSIINKIVSGCRNIYCGINSSV
jgi:hypothetical protein